MTKDFVPVFDRLAQSRAARGAVVGATMAEAKQKAKRSKYTTAYGGKVKVTDVFNWANPDATWTGRMSSVPQMQELPRLKTPDYTFSGGEFHEVHKPNAEIIKTPLTVRHCDYMYYDAARVRLAAQRVAKALPRMMEETGADTVVVLGKSGMSIAYAALMLIDFPLVTVRRPGERPRGGGVQVEGPSDHQVSKYLILDDLVGSGGTADNINSALADEADAPCFGPARIAPECVGILCYHSWDSDYNIHVGNKRVPVHGTNLYMDN